MEKLVGKKIVVTGGAGFIGSHIVKALCQENEVTVIDNLSTGKKENIRDVLPDIKFVQEDIRNKEVLVREMKGCEYVLHQAAISSIPRSTQYPEETFRNNCEGTLKVLLAARECQVQRVIYASSSSVYGNNPAQPKTEDMPTIPISLYGCYKLSEELMTRNFYGLYGLETVSLRYFNVFGPYQDPKSEYAAVIPKFIAAMSQGKSPTMYGDGEKTRDFTFVENVVQANILACLAGKQACGEAINIACNQPFSLNDIVKIMNELMGKDIQPTYTEPRKGDIKHSYADITKAKRLLGYDVKVNAREGLERTIKWVAQKEAYSSSPKQ